MNMKDSGKGKDHGKGGGGNHGGGDDSSAALGALSQQITSLATLVQGLEQRITALEGASASSSAGV